MIDGLYLYHAPAQPGRRIPPGYRLVVAFDKTARRVSLLTIGDLVLERLPVAELRRCRPSDATPRRAARVLERRRRELKRHGHRIADKTIRRVVAALREES